MEIIERMEIAKAIRLLNQPVLSWLGMFLKVYERPLRRKSVIRTFLNFEVSTSAYLTQRASFSKLTKDEKEQDVTLVLTRLAEASYPLFAAHLVARMNSHSFQAEDVPSIELYVEALHKLQDAVFTVKDVLITRIEASSTDSCTQAVTVHRMSKEEQSDGFTEKDLRECLEVEKQAEKNAVDTVCNFLDPDIERLAGLLIQAEKVKIENVVT